MMGRSAEGGKRWVQDTDQYSFYFLSFIRQI